MKRSQLINIYEARIETERKEGNREKIEKLELFYIAVNLIYERQEILFYQMFEVGMCG